MVEIEDPVAFLRVSDKLARLEESKAFESKKWVWIQDQKECFKAAEVKSSKGDIYVVETNDGQVCLYLICFVLCRSQEQNDNLRVLIFLILVHTWITVTLVMSASFRFKVANVSLFFL